MRERRKEYEGRLSIDQCAVLYNSGVDVRIGSSYLCKTRFAFAGNPIVQPRRLLHVTPSARPSTGDRKRERLVC